MLRTLQALLAGSIALTALSFMAGARSAYSYFQPLRGYSPFHAHLMAPQEGLFLGIYIVLGAIAVVGLAACASLLLRWPLARWCRDFGDRLPDWGWMVGGGIWAALASLLVARELLEGAFLTDDEMAMLFQARLLVEGQLWAEPTPFPGVFHYAMMVESPQWYGIYPTGHPAVVALSLLLTGDPRVLISLVAAGWVVLTFLLARGLYERSTAAVATVLLCLSPFFVLTSGSLAAQMTSGLFLLGAANLAIRLDDWKSRWPSILAPLGLGLCLGAAYLSRPWTALIVGLCLACWVGWLWLQRRIPLWSPLLVLICGTPFVLAYLGVNEALTGSPWLTPYEVNFPDRFRLGFGQDAFGVIHTPQMAMAVAGLTLVELNAWTLGWPLSLLPVAVCLVLERPVGRALVVAALPAVMILAHLPVPMAGVHDTGPIYYLEVLPAIIIISARGLVLAAQKASQLSIWEGRARDVLVWTALAATLVGIFGFWRQQVETMAELSEFNRAPYELVERVIPGRAVVFVDEIQTSSPSSWVLGLQPPHPDLSDRVIYANVVRAEQAAEVLRWAEGRRGWFLSRDQRTGDVSLVPLPAPP